MVLDYLSNTLQRYEIFLRYANFSSSFFQVFLRADNPALFGDKAGSWNTEGVLLVRFPQPLYIAAWETNENTPSNCHKNAF